VRRFVSGLALLLAFLAGTAALTSYVADELLLDQSRTGELLGRALGQDDLRQELLTRAVPGYDRLPAVVRSQVDAAADSPTTRKALESVQVGKDGSVSLSRLRSQVVHELRANGQPAIASRVAAATGSVEVSVPSRYLARLTEARDLSRQVWTVGGLVGGGLLLVALLVSPRLRTVRSIGLTVLLACGASALLFRLLPSVVRSASNDPLVVAGAEVVRSEWSGVASTLLPVVVVGAALTVIGLLGGRSRRQGDRYGRPRAR
jgi:hypothetical protein